MSKIDADIKEALDVYVSGNKAKAFLMLKQSRPGMPLSEARQLLKELESAEQNAATNVTDVNEALAEAADGADAFDELTIMVLRVMRRRGIRAGDHLRMSAEEALDECAAIFKSLQHLASCDINPRRAMEAYTESMMTAQNRDASIAQVGTASTHSLRDDLLKLI